MISSVSAQKAFTIKSGNNYLAHRYNGVSYEVYNTTQFSDECVWYTVNNNNYYFTDPGGMQRYLYAQFGLGNDGAGAAADAENPALGAGAALELREAVGNITTSSGGYYFYNWDWGLAHGQQYFNLGGSCPSEFNSEGDECWRCYWLVYDDHDGDGVDTWHMSTTASYESIAHYATFEPVRIIDRPDRVTMQSGGLTALTPFTMTFSTASVAAHSLAGNANIISPYTNRVAPGYMSYALGVMSNCRGNWTVRVCDTTWTYHNYYMASGETQASDHGRDTLPGVQHMFDPAADNITSYSWTLSSTDYLSFASGSAESTSSAVAPTVYYRVPCVEDGGATVTLTLTVTYSDNSTQTRVAVITVNRFLAPPATITCAGVTLTEGDNGTVSPVFANPSYAIVDEGYELSFAGSGLTIDNATKHVITAVTPGQYNVTITSTAEGGVTGTVAVTVLPLAPTVSFTPSAATASVSISENSSCDGGTYQYSLDGETWNAFTSLTVNSGVTVYGRYTCNGQTSEAVSATFQATSGVYSTEKTVVLNDYEDHSWSYYSDPHCPIRSLNPVDVKITYYGNGMGNMTTTDANDNPTTFDADATGVKVGIANGEDQHTFVYYKTLERTDGSTDSYDEKSDATGDAKYTTIPNPFQVRPEDEARNVTITPTTRDVTLTWYSSNWRYRPNVLSAYTYATASFEYTNANGVKVQSDEYSANGSTTVTVKVGTTITLKVKACRDANNYRPTITATYASGTGTISNNSLTATSTTEITQPTGTISSQSINVSVDKYRGFYAWRVKSKSDGLTIKNAATPATTYGVGGIIPAETEILFSTANEYNNSVDFEALWAQAYVVTSNTTTGMNNGVSYERNFMVLTGTNNVNPAQTSGYAYTLSSVYPNGTSNGTASTTTKGSTTVRGGNLTATRGNANYYRPINLSASLKLEYIAFNGDGNLNNNNSNNRTIVTTNNNDFIVGRGVTGTLFEVRGFGGSSEEAINKTTRLESGTYVRLLLLGDYIAYYANQAYTTFSNTVTTRAILGCDYDRAPETPVNNLLEIALNDGNASYNNLYGQIYGADWCAFSSQDNKDNLVFDWTIKSGTINRENPQNGGADYAIYVGAASSTQYIGKRRMTIEGGVMTNIAGSLNAADNNNYDNNYTTGNVKDNVTIRMKNGTVRGSIYGAAAFAGAKGGRTMVYTGGQINGWIAGGANGTRTSGGELFGSTYIYFGGNAQVGYNTSGTSVGGNSDYTENNTTYYGVNGAGGGNIFGAGCGILPTQSNHTTSYNSYKTGTVGRVNNSTIAIADNSTVCADVYGGGNYGWVRADGRSDIYILGGTVKGKVFGGSNNQRGQTVNILMRQGTVLGGVYGGSNTWGYINNDITVKIEGGTVGSATARGNVHGGGYGQNTITCGNIDVTIGHADTTRANWPTIYGDVYGGSALGSVNGGTVEESGNGNNANATLNAAYSSGQHVYVTVNNGLILSANNPIDLGNGAFEGTGSVYGGGLGSSSVASNVYGGTVRVLVNGGTMERTFGCNNRNGLPYGAVSTTIHGGTIGNVYGGGNAAAYGTLANNSIPYVTMDGGTVLHDVYGGGLGSGAALGDNTTNRNTSVIIEGTARVLENVFGGGSAAQVNGNTLVKVRGHAKVGNNVYGGGNAAVVTGNTNVEVGGN